MNECIQYKANTFICATPQTFYTKQEQTCEWNALNKFSYDRCELKEINATNTFIELRDNRWIF